METKLLAELYARYAKSAYLYTLSLCGNREIAQDIVSEAFEKAFFAPEKNGHFQYWLLAVCRNLWIDMLRKSKRRADAPPEDIPSEDTTEAQLLMRERREIVLVCLMTLPPRYREILTLHYYAELPLGEIAALMSLSPSNAKTLICRARAKLKTVLEEQDYEF